MLPDFLVIGAAKSGTTSLCDALARHEGIWLYPRKEANFFTRHYDKGLGWYAALFAEAPAGKLRGEGTPAYTFATQAATVAARIAADLPKVRLIYMVRDPVERIRSQYVQEIANGRENIGLSRAILTWCDLAATSRYEAILQTYLAHIPAEQILVIFHEDMLADFPGTFARVLAFLDLPQRSEIALGHLGSRGDCQRGNGLLRRLRKTALYRQIGHRLPVGLSRFLTARLSRKVETGALDLTISPEAQTHLDRLLAEDSRAFLARMARPGWAISPAARP